MSASKLEIKEKKPQKIEQVVVNYAFFEKYRKRNLKARNHLRSKQKYDLVSGECSPKPILRKPKFFAENMDDEDEQEEPLPTKQMIKTRENKKKTEETSPSKETTINGIPLSKIQRPKNRKKSPSNKPKSLKLKQLPAKENPPSPKKIIKAESPKKLNRTIDELEKEGARNFARCLLGILPSVLKATEPSSADELLQQFASDVCEAVTCMTLKRKNVPNFGTVRTFEISEDETVKNSGTKDPSLNAECVYKAVYEVLKLSLELNQLGFYEKPGTVPHISQVCGSFEKSFEATFSQPIQKH